mgnify:CR=1 FL=1
MEKAELMDQLRIQLRSHDWFYEYSDDHSYYRRGRAERSAIHAVMRQLTELGAGDEAREMFNKLSPEGFGYNG